MPQNIDSTTKTIGLWLLNHKNDKHITSFEVTQEFPNVAKSRVSNVLTRFCREGYLTRISRGFYRVVGDNVLEFERRLKPSAGEIEVIPAIDPSEEYIDICLKQKKLSLNGLLIAGSIKLPEDRYIAMLSYLEEYAKYIQGMIKFARLNIESFEVPSLTEETILTAEQFIKEHFE
jgi:hypothetical protein